MGYFLALRKFWGLAEGQSFGEFSRWDEGLEAKISEFGEVMVLDKDVGGLEIGVGDLVGG